MTITFSRSIDALRRATASVLLFGLITMSFPLGATAQETPPPPEEPAVEVVLPEEEPPTPLECEPGFHVEGEECVADEAVVVECLDGTVLDAETGECVPLPPEEPVVEEEESAPMMRLLTVQEDSCIAVSDEDTLADGSPSVATYVHPVWTHALEGDNGAKWIWNAAEASQAELPETVVFTKTVSLTDVPSSATLEIASDNGYVVTVNGDPVSCDGTQANNFSAVESCSITLQAGDNDFEFTVTNDVPDAPASPQDNPSGLIFKVTTEGASCGEPEEPVMCEPGIELLENGDFEATEVTNGALWDIFNLDDDPNLAWMAEWLTSNVLAPEVANIELQETGLNGWSATGSGSQWAELDSDWGGPSSGQSGEEGQVAISQTIDTVPGETYTLSFDFSARPGTAASQNELEVLYNGDVFGSVGPSSTAGNQTEWSSHQFSFVATSSETVLTFKDAGSPNDSLGTFVDNASLMCQEPEPSATLVATKIVCPTEGSLPNWGAGGADITASTADDFLTAHPECHLEPDWQFQWTTDGADPDDNATTTLGSPWETFTTGVDGVATASIPADANVRVREVLQDGYLTFTGQVTDQPVSAEVYCASDVLHYDNWEWIDNTEEDETYYCVAFNVPLESEQCNPDAQTVLLSSDGNTQDESGIASIVTFLHESWLDAIDALWIWKDATTSNADALSGTEETFTRQFTITGAPLDASLDLAADNQVVVEVNGTELVNDPDEVNYTATTTYAVPAALLHSGLNTITFTVTNMDHADANTPETNPAGLLYKLIMHDNQCEDPTPATAKVYIYKYVDGVQVADDSGLPSFPMTSSWDAANLGAGSGSYVLGNYEGGTALQYAAATSPMSVPADYTTQETVGGSSPVVASANECSSGKFYLSGYRYGDTLAEAQGASLSATAPAFTDITNDRHVIVENVACGDGGDEDLRVHIFKYLLENESASQIPNDAEGVPHFPMIAVYDIAGVGTNLNPGDGYVLGDGGGVGGSDDGLLWAANTIPLSPGDDYGTNEVTDGSVVVGPNDQCVPGKYRLVGYQVGNTLAEAQGAAPTTVSPFFADLQDDKYVIVVNEECGPDGGGDETGTLIIEKVSVGGTGVFSVTVNPADEGEDSFPVSLDTAEDGFDSESNIVATGTYDITESVPEGWTLQDVSCEYEESSVGIDIVNGETVTIEEGDTVTCTFTNTLDGEPTNTSETVLVTPSDMQGWIFFPENTVGGQTGQMVAGPSTPPLGTGSAELLVSTNTEGEVLATFEHAGTRLDQIASLAYSTYRATPGVALPALQFEFDNDRTDADNTFKGRLVYEPYYTHTVIDSVWQDWDPMDDSVDGSLNGNWWFSNGTIATASGCSIATPCTWSEILALYPDGGIRDNGAFTGATLFKVGSGGGVYTGYVDELSMGITTGSNTHTTTYDFDPDAPEPQTSDGGGNGDGGSPFAFANNNDDDGEVLGAETGPSCSAIIDTFMALGMNNDVNDVMDLQGFLNEHMNAGIPVTGIFGAATDAAVHAFQKLYWEDVIAPWFPFPEAGMHDADDSTGYVYKTTKWKINNIVCPGSEAMPSLP